MDGIRGLVLVIGFLLTVELNLFNCESSPFYCQYVDSIYELSQRGDCWKSQLTDRSRYRLFSFFDWYRANVIAGTCAYCLRFKLPKYCSIFRMNYHWILEAVASTVHSLRDNTGSLNRTFREILEEVSSRVRKLPEYKRVQIDLLKSFDYTLTMLNFKIETPLDYTQDDVITKSINHMLQNVHTYFWLAMPDEEKVWVFKFYLQSIMAPSTGYFGCSLFCNAARTKAKSGEELVEHRVTCIFSRVSNQLYPGIVSEETCALYEPGGVLTYTGDNLPICVASEYVKRYHLEDWPCQFHYAVDKNTFNPTTKYCTNDKNVDPDYTKLVFPDRSFPEVRIVYNGSDSISLKNPLDTFEDSFCKKDIGANVLLIPQRLIYCSDSVLMFATIGGVLLVIVAAMIIFHAAFD